MKPSRRSETVRKWLSRVAFGAAVLALLGTSRPSWIMHAPGIADAGIPPPGTAIRVTVDASREPTIRYQNRFGGPVDPPWGRGNGASPTKASYLLPPGATLQAVDIRDYCGGGGCCSNEKCVPTEGSFVRATAEPVHVWTKVETREAKLVAEPPKDATRLPHIEVLIAGDTRFIEVALSGKTPQDRLSGWNGKPVAIDCGTPIADAGGAATCAYFGYSEPLKTTVETTVETTVVASVTAFGECPDPRAPCSPPEAEAATPPRILSVAVKVSP